MATVLLFNTCARADLAARLHSSECPMVRNMASKRGRRTPVIRQDNPTDEDIADLNERGFTVKRCKCLGR